MKIRIMKAFPIFFLSAAVLLSLMACQSGEDPQPIPIPNLNTGSFLFTQYQPFETRPIRVYFHLPEQAGPDAPILFVFHGAGRNASEYRDAWTAKADEYGFLLFAPRFSSQAFPGGDAYNLGNIFVDGDMPSAASLNPELEWTFSVIEPLFDFVKDSFQNQSDSYSVYGHSAGAQFTHRFLFFKPQARIKQLVAAAAGWYTVPDQAIDFPYGIGQSPMAPSDLPDLFARKLIILIGEADNDPQASSLRRNAVVDQQGDNRLDRARHFFLRSQELAQDLSTPFHWQYESVPQLGHDFVKSAPIAADLLFD